MDTKKEHIEINIVNIFPNLLNIACDFGNIQTLKKRLEWRNIKVNIENINYNEEIDYKKFDIFYIGGGQENQLKSASLALLKHNQDIENTVKQNKIILAFSTGFNLLLKNFELSTKEQVIGLGLIDGYSKYSNKRFNGNITLNTSFLTPNTIVGYENHNNLTFLKNNSLKLGENVTKNHPNSENTLGAIDKNIIGTYLQGPVLTKNPAFTDYIINKAIGLKTNNNNYILPKLNDDIENTIHTNLIYKKY